MYETFELKASKTKFKVEAVFSQFSILRFFNGGRVSKPLTRGKVNPEGPVVELDASRDASSV